jgi:RNA polymerase sigma-70 factor (ECF subfamily)
VRCSAEEEFRVNYDELYKQYYRRVSKYLGGIVGATEAEDLAQEVFIKVENKLTNLKDPSRVSSWIFKIALNTARDWLRQPSSRNAARAQAASPAGEKEEDAVGQVPDTQSRTPEQRLVRTEMIQCFIDFVRKLPRQYYEVYVLSEFEELSDKAIAKRLSLPLETVKMRLHRARAKLYDELRAHCRCYYNERGELMGDLKT